MRPGDYRMIQGTVDSARGRVRQLGDEQATRREALRVEVARVGPDYDEGAVRRARRGLADVETALREATERLTALEAQLPSKAARAEAARQVEALRAEADDHGGRLAAAWARLLEALGPAEEAAREVAAAREARRQAAAQLEELAARFGLELPAPPPAEPGRDAVHVAQLVAMLIGDAAGGPPRDVVLRDLAGARARAQA
jgi:chromosome segregation ATPase